MAQLQRKVLFFSIETKEGDIEDQTTPFEEVCRSIMRLSPAQRMHQIAQAGPDEFLRLYMFEKRPAGSDFYSGVFVRYRVNNITAGSEAADELRDTHLPEGYRPTEITHFVYSPQTRILSVEYNHNGPKHIQFINYINVMQSKAGREVIYYIPEVISHPDVVEEIRQTEYIKTIELTIPKAEIPSLAQKNDWYKAFLAAANVGNAGTITVKISGSKKRGDKTPLMSSSELASSLENDDIDLGIFGTAKVEAMMTYGLETINLLQNKIDSTISIPSTDTATHLDEVFEAIRTVYTANKELLVRASQAEG
jgi:hypothetical protein